VEAPDDSGRNAMVHSNTEQMYAARREANGMIEHINLNLTEGQWLELDSYCREGQSKLIIAYHALPTPLKGQQSNEF